ncbi:MAG: lipopolysaccharide biosynthesis protein [Candidatus Babeliaceae bacterium]|nr:lipopolysaccharide biosynthesis protein [Candidatus Babeliaceae bacterium]
MSLGKSVAKGALWLVLLRLLNKTIGLISTLVLVRLLAPEDFGIVAIAMSLFALIDLISRFGFDTVLIQKETISRNDYDTAWTLNFCFGFLACLLLFLLSFPVSIFYENKDLKTVLMVISLMFLINGMQNIGVVDFRKNLTFDKEFKLLFFPKILSFFITIALAFSLRSYWALVFGSLIWKILEVANGYILHSYRPSLSLSSWRELYNFSKWLFINNLFMFLYTKTPELVVGKILTPQAVGFLTVSHEVSTLPTAELASNINRAAYPGYSKVAKDVNELNSLYLGVMSSIAIFAYPAGIGLAVVSDSLVPVFLGEQWLDAAYLIKYLAIVGLLFAINSNTGYVFLAVGKPRVLSIISLVRVLIFIPCLILLTHFYGLHGSAQALLISAIAVFFLYHYLMYFKLSISLYEIILVHIRPFLSSIMMGTIVYIFGSYFLMTGLMSDYLVLACSVVLGIALYTSFLLLFWFLFHKPDGPEKNFIKIIRNKLNH